MKPCLFSNKFPFVLLQIEFAHPLSDLLLQYLAEVVGRLHTQLAADMRPCTADIALLLVKDGADVALLLPLQEQTADLTFGGGEFGKERFLLEHSGLPCGKVLTDIGDDVPLQVLAQHIEQAVHPVEIVFFPGQFDIGPYLFLCHPHHIEKLRLVLFQRYILW